MKTLFTLVITFCFTISAFGQIWSEDFESNSVGDGLYYYSFNLPPVIEGITSNIASPPWDIEFGFLVIKSEFISSVQEDATKNKLFKIANVEKNAPEGNVKWASEAIDVSAQQFNCSVDVTWDGSSYDASDYLKIEFYINGFVSQTINKDGSYLNSATSPETFLSDNFITGDSLKIVISSVNNSSDTITFDNVTVNEYVPVNNTIYEIQYTTVPGPNGTYPSLLVDQEVTLEAAVTAIKDGVGYYLQETDGNNNGNGAADWRGIIVYDNTLSGLAEGDIVNVTGTVYEFNGITTISSVTSSTITAEDPISYFPDMIINVLEEKNESVLNVIRFFRVVDSNNGDGDIRFTAGIGESPTEGNHAFIVAVDKSLYDFATFADQSKLYEELIGVTNHTGGLFTLAPRSIADIDWTDVPVSAEKTTIESPTITAITNSIVLHSTNEGRASIYNLAGQMVKTLNIQEGRTEIEMNAGVYVVKLNTGNEIITKKVLVQ